MESESYFIIALGQRITFYREKACLTVSDISGLTGIEIDNIVAYENGSLSIKVEDFLKIIKALEIDSAKLMEGIELKK